MKKRFYLITLLFTLVGCSDEEQQKVAPINSSTPALERNHDSKLVRRGQALYTQHCAQCHGVEGEGDPHWRKRDSKGLYPPPPLNGTGHAWHHPSSWLREKIRRGGALGDGKMPPQNQLSEADIKALLTWFQSQWPDPVYEAWLRVERKDKADRIKDNATDKQT